jgi:hypothetical protein
MQLSVLARGLNLDISRKTKDSQLFLPFTFSLFNKISRISFNFLVLVLHFQF